jgi:hypothetical protein
MFGFGQQRKNLGTHLGATAISSNWVDDNANAHC